MSPVIRWWLCLACLVAGRPAQAAEPQVSLSRLLYVPPALETALCFYQSFESGWSKPEFNAGGFELRGGQMPAVPGIAGQGCRVAGPGVAGHSFTVSGEALWPVRPLTVMAWWRLDSPMREETGFNLLSLRGRKGLVASFVRGKGEWCALPEPRRIFQVYYFPGISNRNDTWSERIWPAPGAWHHVAITVRSAADIDVFWDGRRVTRYSIKGRRFRADDINLAAFGNNPEGHAMTIDEAMILRRALSEDEIAAYVAAVRALAARGLPAVLPGS